MKKYEYLISYHYGGGICIGLGTACVTRKTKLKTHKDIQDVSKFIETENNLQNVGIISFQRLKPIKD